MKIVLCAIFVATVSSAPTYEGVDPEINEYLNQQLDYLRGRRSFKKKHFGGSPCASAATPSSYQYAPAYPQSNYGYASPYGSMSSQAYRAVSPEEEEMMSFSDSAYQERFPMARYAYEAPALPAAHAPHASHSSGPAYGVFPNANLGPCGVPLLFSCSPSIVKGTVAKPHYTAPSSDGYQPGSYRDVDVHLQTEHAALQEKPSEHLSAPSDGKHGAVKA